MRGGPPGRRCGARLDDVTNPAPRLSALHTDLDSLRERIATLARELDHEPTDRAAVDLYETERALVAASRRLMAARRELERLARVE